MVNFERRYARVGLVIPAVILLGCTMALYALFADTARAYDTMVAALVMGGALVAAVAQVWEKRLTPRQQPRMIGRKGVYIPAMPQAVAERWTDQNPSVVLADKEPVAGGIGALGYLIFSLASVGVAVVAMIVVLIGKEESGIDTRPLLIIVAGFGFGLYFAVKALRRPASSTNDDGRIAP